MTKLKELQDLILKHHTESGFVISLALNIKLAGLFLDWHNSKQLTEGEIKKHFDKFLSFYYNAPCSGCPEGHASFWKTIIESPEWKEWQKVGHYDFVECECLGVMSKGHWEDFVKFIKKAMDDK